RILNQHYENIALRLSNDFLEMFEIGCLGGGTGVDKVDLFPVNLQILINRPIVTAGVIWTFDNP
ncbi:MAG TPA: hypothetical protein D7H94_01435, partial [Candidatus Poseidoniales archaeon]